MGPRHATRDTIQSYNTSFFQRRTRRNCFFNQLWKLNNCLVWFVFPCVDTNNNSNKHKSFFPRRKLSEGCERGGKVATQALRSSGVTQTFPFSVNVFCKRVTGPGNVLARWRQISWRQWRQIWLHELQSRGKSGTMTALSERNTVICHCYKEGDGDRDGGAAASSSRKRRNHGDSSVEFWFLHSGKQKLAPNSLRWLWINCPDDKKTNSSETRLRQQGLGPTAKGQRSEITASPSTGRMGNPTPASCGNTFRFIASSEVKRSHFHVASRGVKRPAQVSRGS